MQPFVLTIVFTIKYNISELLKNKKTTDMKKLLIPICAFMMMFSCDSLDFIEGIGPVVDQELNLDSFDKISTDCSFDVVIEQGSTQKVVASGQQNIIDRLRTNVVNDEWLIDLDNGNYRDFDLTIHITMPNVEALTIDGSGDITLREDFKLDDLNVRIDGSGEFTLEDQMIVENELAITVDGSGETYLQDVSAKRIDVFVDGSGDMTLRGNCDDLDIKVSGSGDVMAFALEAISVDIDTNASGDCEVKAIDELIVDIDGSGDVFYKGKPAISSRVNGSGRLRNAN